MENRENTYETHFPDKDPGPTVLIVDDEEPARIRLKRILSSTSEADGLRILYASSRETALDILSKNQVHVVLLDKNLGLDPDDEFQNGIKAIPEMIHCQPHLQILMVTGSGDVQDAVEAIRLGACGYVTKETKNELLTCQINRAIDISKISIQKFRQDRVHVNENISLGGKSKIFQEILDQAQLLAESNRPVLLLGETGTGKSEIAKWINECRRKFFKQDKRPFFAVNIAALAKDIVERELFGNEKGAYTDANQTRQGFFEMAGDGTLFLDEIGEASLDLQAKLLTVIETGVFYRLGGTKPFTSNPKIICATNRDLEGMVAAGKFRPDLYERIKSFPIRMPTISERREDIPHIIEALLPKCCKQNNVFIDFKDIPNDFIDHLTKNPPLTGNIRGIEHQLDRLLVFSPKNENKKPILKNWKGIPGLYLKNQEKGTSSSLGADAITLDELKRRPFNVLGEGFPGLIQFLETIKLKTIAESVTKFQRKVDRAKALDVHPSFFSRLDAVDHGVSHHKSSTKKLKVEATAGVSV